MPTNHLVTLNGRRLLSSDAGPLRVNAKSRRFARKFAPSTNTAVFRGMLRTLRKKGRAKPAPQTP